MIEKPAVGFKEALIDEIMVLDAGKSLNKSISLKICSRGKLHKLLQ
jgi:hypothetical protein